MNKIPFTSAENNISFLAAQNGVTRSVKRFEQALEKLAEKVEDSAQQFQHIKDIASTPKDIAIAVKSQAFWVAETVKKNPASYLIAAASIFGAYWWLRSQKFH